MRSALIKGLQTLSARHVNFYSIIYSSFHKFTRSTNYLSKEYFQVSKKGTHVQRMEQKGGAYLSSPTVPATFKVIKQFK